jgi:thymidine phosphorylase
MKARTIIDRFAKVQSDQNMNGIIKWAKSEEITDDEIIYLANILANSGRRLELSKEQLCADIPSTGGPTSLSTLLCPLVLKEIGFIVPKLGVEGRPAGGIDVLAQIPNYKTEFNYPEILLCLKLNRYCHFLAGKEFAPLDAILFKYRSKVDAKSIFPLVIASILSKKIAVNLNSTGLDVRVAKFGNFGTTWEEAKQNSQKFIRISNQVGINAVCFLNDINVLQQPYIGRGESLAGLSEIFYGEPKGLLKKHLAVCINMGVSLLKSIENYSPFSMDTLRKHFIDNLISQGSSENAFIQKVHEVKIAHKYQIDSPSSGFLKIDIQLLRDAIVWGQNALIDCKFSDPCGVIFKKTSNELIDRNEMILTYRVDNRIKDEFQSKLISSIKIDSSVRNDVGFEKID